MQGAAAAAAAALDRAVGAVRSRLARNLASLADAGRRLTALEGRLDDRHATAVQAADNLADLRTEIATTEETAGDDVDTILAKVDAAREAHAQAELTVEPARSRNSIADVLVAQLTTRLEAAATGVADAGPAADAAYTTLLRLLDLPGVREALGLLEFPDPADRAAVLAAVEAKATGRTLTRTTVIQRYDDARAALSGIWQLDLGDETSGLSTFVATHDDNRYTPPQASVRAQELKERATAALDAAEATALNDFVIGRLPGAIGAAWTRVHDWVRVVNEKMKVAAASSGVGVRVSVTLRDDLPQAERTVYELACRVADAVRTPQQRVEVGQALRRLIDAADGETMAERIGAAVNVRTWLDITYQVARPGKPPERWSSRTGLSGGERRLVVLAPMIAALAATFDNYAETGLRLAALDEVPAEVDERGREGLARFIASLDLDLICTSYLWDGAPGAWDGVDAHDLEAASDGTVVAFPMLVRGELDLPGDDPVLTR